MASELTHLDLDGEMIRIAAEKYKHLGLNVKMMHKDASKVAFPVASFDCIFSVNALYAMPEPASILRRAFHWLKPGGALFVINLGRVQNTAEWTSFLIRSNVRRLGLIRTLRVLLNEGLVISRENRKIATAQRAGVYWQHSTEQFGELLRGIGFEVDRLQPVYRGYSDLACCRKPIAAR
jgi:ubiquinone/menaquinone biosynthesis C-methylase UbiE